MGLGASWHHKAQSGAGWAWESLPSPVQGSYQCLSGKLLGTSVLEGNARHVQSIITRNNIAWNIWVPFMSLFIGKSVFFSERTKLAALAKVDFLLQHLRKKQIVLQCTLRMSLLIELYSSPDKSHAGPSLMETIHGICTIYDLDFSTYPWPSWGKGQFCHNKDGSSSWQGLLRGECIWCQIWAWFKSSNANNWWKMFAFVLFEKKKWSH